VQLWFGDVLPPKADGTDAAKVECTHTIRREEITAFCRSTNNNSEVIIIIKSARGVVCVKQKHRKPQEYSMLTSAQAIAI
jgi:hypothetical protein